MGVERAKNDGIPSLDAGGNLTVHLNARPYELRSLPSQTAIDAVSGFVPGGRVIGLTKGQFSLIDLIRALIRITGPARVALSTWSSGVRDAEHIAWLLGSGEITGITMLVDQSFINRAPVLASQIAATFGENSLRVSLVHAKVAVLQNDDWNVVIRSSMNLNRNPRHENFDVDDDPQLAEFFREWIQEVTNQSHHYRDYMPQFEASQGGGIDKAAYSSVKPSARKSRLDTSYDWLFDAQSEEK